MKEFDGVLPKDDVMFKIIFGDPKHSRVLIHFLNCVVKPKSPIKSVEIAKSELTPEYISQKGVRLDIVAHADNGEIINIEMQRKDEKDMKARSLFYWSKLFFGQLEVGKEYYKLKRTISINILDFSLFKDDDRYWRKGYIKDDQTSEKFTDLLEMHFIELNKMRKLDKESPLTFWVEFFKDPYSKAMEKLYEVAPEIREAKEIYEKAKTDPEAQELMRVREKAVRDYANDVAIAKNEGLIESKKETALKMLADGLPTETISKYTGLSLEKVRSLSGKGDMQA
jgi:predicted transposase/invertase (TIGR01784 family)